MVKGKYSEITVGMLGNFRVEKDGETVAYLENRKWEEFFAYTLLRSRTPTSLDGVARAMWPDSSPAAARNRLYESAHRIRARLEEIGVDEDIISTRTNVFPHPSVKTDVDRFRELCGLIQADPERAGVDLISKAREVYGEGLLPGFTGAWVSEERSALRSLYEQTLGAAALGGEETLSAFISPPTVQRFESPSTTADMATYVRQNHERLKTLATSLAENMWTVDREFWFRTVELSIDDVKATIEWAIEAGNQQAALDLAAGFWNYWGYTGQESVGRRYVEHALAASHGRGDRATRAEVLSAAAVAAASAGDESIAIDRIQDALDLYRQLGDPTRLSVGLHRAALVEEHSGNPEKCVEFEYQSLDIHRRAGHALLITKRLLDTARAERHAGNFGRSRDLLEEAIDRLGDQDQWLRARALSTRALLAMSEFHPMDWDSAEASELLDQAMSDLKTASALFEKFNSSKYLSHSLRALGIAHQWRDNYGEARRLYIQSRDIALAGGDMCGAGNALRELGDLAADEGDTERAVTLVRQSIALLRAVGDPGGAAKSEEKLGELLDES